MAQTLTLTLRTNDERQDPQSQVEREFVLGPVEEEEVSLAGLYDELARMMQSAYLEAFPEG